MLVIPDFLKDFLTFSFASQDTTVVVLLQKNADGLEQPIAFFSKTLRDSELKYSTPEKQAYALVKTLKFFRIYILHSKIISYVPNAAIKEILTHLDSEGKRGRWIVKIMEYDVEIKPTKLVKGHGLVRLLADSNYEALGLHLISNQPIQEELQTRQNKEQIMDNYAESEWYADIVKFLLNL